MEHLEGKYGRKALELALFVIELHGHCKAFSALPYPGGVMEQPALLMDLLSEVESAVSEELERRARREVRSK